MKVIAVLPAFNAERTIRKTYDAIPKDVIHEVIVVDDASTDNTVQTAQAIPHVTLIRHTKNKGYGGNQKTCYTEALARGADIIVMIHPDFQYDPTYVPHLIQPILRNQADFVIGSRLLATDPKKHGMHWWRYLGNRFLTTIQNAVLRLRLSDAHSGYRAYSRRCLEQIPYENFSNNFVFDAQMLAAIARSGLRVQEVPIPTRYTSESSSISLRSSITYGILTLWHTLKQN